MSKSTDRQLVESVHSCLQRTFDIYRACTAFQTVWGRPFVWGHNETEIHRLTLIDGARAPPSGSSERLRVRSPRVRHLAICNLTVMKPFASGLTKPAYSASEENEI